MADDLKQTARGLLITGLRNAHAVERQAISTLEPQIEQLNEYPEFQAKVREHVEVSREQAKRIDIALRQLDASSSPIKGALMSVMGMGQSMIQGFADDAPLKAALADAAFERYEIASYRALLALADLAGASEVKPGLEENLREEEAMEAWLQENIPAVARRYAELEHEEAERHAEAGAERPAAPEDAGGPERPAADRPAGPPKNEPKTEAVDPARSEANAWSTRERKDDAS